MINKIYRKLPTGLKSEISKINFVLSGRPLVQKDNIKENKFPNGFKGGMIITADFELGWALRYSKTGADPVAYAMRERKNVPVILKELEKHNIPITWATVGHLFLRECKKGDHDWMHRIPHFDDHWKFTEGDWFDCDPYSKWEDGKAWYAPDLIEDIIKSKVDHEIGCHTFSHIDCTYKNCPPDVIDDEMKACQEIAAEWGLPKLTSIAFPGGTAGNYETLKKHGIDIYRKKYSDFQLTYPFRDKTGLLVTATGPGITVPYSEWSMEYTFYRYKKAIDKAIKTGTIAHLWFHPSQVEKTFNELLPLILEYSAQKRDEGLLWVGTMKEIADHINNNNVLD